MRAQKESTAIAPTSISAFSKIIGKRAAKVQRKLSAGRPHEDFCGPEGEMGKAQARLERLSFGASLLKKEPSTTLGRLFRRSCNFAIQETVAARRMVERVEKLGVRAECVGADKAYGSGEFLNWLLQRGVQPHIPVIDRRHQTAGHFTRDQFRYEPAEDVYYCPQGKPLRYRGRQRANQAYAYCATGAQCQGCPQKKLCTPGPYRKLSVSWYEPARQAVRALAGTPAYERSRRARYKIEALFAELKQRMRLQRVRLRCLWNVGQQFLLAATAQNLKRLVRFLAQSSPTLQAQVG